MKKVDFICCNVEYTIESDVQKTHRCYKCEAKYKKTKEGKWEKKTK